MVPIYYSFPCIWLFMHAEIVLVSRFKVSASKKSNCPINNILWSTKTMMTSKKELTVMFSRKSPHCAFSSSTYTQRKIFSIQKHVKALDKQTMHHAIEVLTEMSNLGFGFTEQERWAHMEALAHVKIEYRIDLQVCWFQCKQPPVPTTINNFTSAEVCWFTTINNF